MKSMPGNYSLITLLPGPRVYEWPAEAVPPPQVEGLNVHFSIKEILSSKSIIILDLVATWSDVDADYAYYELRLVKQNTTRDDIRSIHSDEEVRRFCIMQN